MFISCYFVFRCMLLCGGYIGWGLLGVWLYYVLVFYGVVGGLYGCNYEYMEDYLCSLRYKVIVFGEIIVLN